MPYHECMSKRQSDSQKRFAFASQLSFSEGENAELPKEIQVIPCGEWNHPYYGPMKIAPADIAEMKKNFDDGVRLDLPITAGHDNGMGGGELPAVAWYGELIDKGYEGLWTTVKWNAEGERLLKEHAFKYFSTEFYATYADPQDSTKIYKNVLCGGALTNRPYFKEMQPVGTFSETGIMSQDFNDNEHIPMELKLSEVVLMQLSELKQEHKDFLIAHKAELTAEQLVTFKEIVGEVTPAPVTQVKATDTKVITMSEKEVNDLRTAAEEGRQAMEKIVASERAAVVEKLMASPTNAAGRFAEAERATVTSFVATLTEAQRTTFAELVKAIPKTLTFDEKGDGGGQGSDAEAVADQIDKEVKAIMASDKTLSNFEAQNRLFAEKPELKKQYDASLK